MRRQRSARFAAASARCFSVLRAITGAIGDDTVLGYYCPDSGRFNFLRSNSPSGTYQAYTGNLSETVLGNVVMTGTFVDYIDNPQGEYSFIASPAD